MSRAALADGGTYDLVVLGSGTAAQVASSRVRAAGWTVAVIDHRPFGGTCALRGCDPKKMLISGEEAVDAVRRMRGHGVEGNVRIAWPDLVAFRRSPEAEAEQFREDEAAKPEADEQGEDVHPHGLPRPLAAERRDDTREQRLCLVARPPWRQTTSGGRLRPTA